MKILSLAAACFALTIFTIGCSREDKEKPNLSTTEVKKEIPPSTETESGTETSGVKHLDADAASNLHDESDDLVVLDIRTPEEFAEGHIQGAVNIDFKAPTFRDEIAKLDKTKPYLVHCRSGGRSTQSLPVFEELGFTGIIHLDGGFLAWKEGGNAYVTE